MAKNGLLGLDVMQVALELADAVNELGLKGNIRDQLTRASESVVLNIAESHPTIGADRRKGFRVALKEASETKGALLLLKIRREITQEAFDRIWTLVDRICAMLWRLSYPR